MGRWYGILISATCQKCRSRLSRANRSSIPDEIRGTRSKPAGASIAPRVELNLIQVAACWCRKISRYEGVFLRHENKCRLDEIRETRTSCAKRSPERRSPPRRLHGLRPSRLRVVSRISSGIRVGNHVLANLRHGWVPSRSSCRASYFFTVTLRDRGSDMLVARADDLRAAVGEVRRQRQFTIAAAAILPDHLHMIWILPPDDADYSGGWWAIKSRFSQALVLGGVRLRRNRRSEFVRWQRRSGNTRCGTGTVSTGT